MAGVTSTKKIKGQPHLLAYITPNEVKKLKALGGQETMTKEGIPAYPEYDNYGYSSKSDFDKGDVSKSNDPNVRNVGTFETYRGKKNIGVDLALKAKYAKDKKDREDAQKALAKGQTYGYGPNQSVFEKMNTYNTNFQKRQNIKLAQKRAFELAKRLEKYVHGDMDMDYDFTQDIYGNKIDKGLENLISNKNTSIESTRPNLYNVNPSTKYSITQALLDKMRPDTQVKLENTKKAMRDYNMLSVDPNISKEKLNAIGNRGKTPDQINPPRDREGPQPYIPINYNTGAATIEDIEPYTNDFVYRFGTGQNVGDDVTQGFYNQGGRVPRAFGGIMDSTTGRKAYGLGSVFKSVGKAVSGVAKAAGKVLKSDVGKAALIGLGGYYLGGGQMFGLRPSAPGFSFGRLGSSLFMKPGTEGFSFRNLDPLKFAGLTTLIGAGMGPAKQDSLKDFDNRGGRLIDPLTGKEAVPAEMRASLNEALDNADGDPEKIKAITNAYAFLGPDERLGTYLPYRTYGVKDGGRIGKAEGGLMDLGGMEKDYRAEGGFVPIGREEKADDVPARLSVNEFVFTADAVRNAGGGDIDKGAEVMENMMKNLENGGRVSEESQGKGNTGAQEMFSVSERIGEVI